MVGHSVWLAENSGGALILRSGLTRKQALAAGENRVKRYGQRVSKTRTTVDGVSVWFAQLPSGDCVIVSPDAHAKFEVSNLESKRLGV